MAWRAVYCVSGQEASVVKQLREEGLEVFFPHEKFRRHKKVLGTTQVRWIISALFPGYIFVAADYLDLGSISGAISVVRSGLRPLVIPTMIISTLQALASPEGLIRSEDLTKNSAHFKSKLGDEISIIHGPFSGLIAKIASLAKLDETGEISAWVDLMGGQTNLRVHFSDVKPKAA